MRFIPAVNFNKSVTFEYYFFEKMRTPLVGFKCDIFSTIQGLEGAPLI